MDLFSKENESDEKAVRPDAPLAFRMAPRSLDEYIGQQHIIGEGKLLRRAIEADRLGSVIFYGPPGTGKTALARVIASKTGAHFDWLNAATANLDDLRRAVSSARARKANNIRTVLFLDEIHRFNKLQQDALLPDVEEGTVTLMAATVENPFFYVNNALLSRSQVFELKPLTSADLVKIINNALKDSERGLGKMRATIDDAALEHLAAMSDGDARKALSSLEIAALTTQLDKDGKINITLESAQESIQKKAVVYDKAGDQHYDTISAFIKSMRGSDPDAAVYYLAKMLYAGEDPRFIARRIVICASEDVGNADPMALVLAVSALRAVEFVGMPEARIPLSQAATYIAAAKKSNAAYAAIEEAMQDIKTEATQEVPDHLKDSHYKGAAKLGRGEGYKYPHDFGGHVEQEYMKQKKKYYRP
ncbi:MAG: replication-associated recombination protein A [Dissulfurispiraceae bacterium]|jgi:putative ATPase|nr:replication-associated recombination protein A [Dissulfurispiraceae bacterium]